MRNLVHTVTLLALACGPSFGTGPVKALTSAGSFSLASALPGLSIRYMAATSGAFYFLAYPGPTSYHAVLVKTGLSGTVAWKLDLGPDEVTSFALGSDGSVFLPCDADPGVRVLKIVDSSGHLQSSREVPDMHRLARGGDGRIYVLSGSGVVRPIDGPSSLSLQASEPGAVADSVLLPAGGSTLAVLNMQDGALRVADGLRGQVADLPLSDPLLTHARDVKNSREASRPGHVFPAVAAATSAGSSVYFLLYGFRPQGGVPLVVADTNAPSGSVLRTFSVPIADTDGRVKIPQAISVVDGSLYLLDSNGTVTRFSL